MRRIIKFISDHIRFLLTTPTAELSRWQKSARFFLELCRQGAKQFSQDRAGQMAAALAYRTIFGFVPVIIIVTLIFRAFGGAEQLADFVDRVLIAARLYSVAGPDASATLGGWCRTMIHDIDTKVSGKAVGMVGVPVLAWAAIALLTTVERSFNTICRAPENRPLYRRVPLYWTAITIGPALLYLSFHLEGKFETLVLEWGGRGAMAAAVGQVLGLVPRWLFLIGMYALLPNVRVAYGPACLGAFLAALLWTIATGAFSAYMALSFRSENSSFAILYGTLGLVPLFLIWVYFLWLIILFGLEVTTLIRTVRSNRDQEIHVRPPPPPLTDPAAVVSVMRFIADRYAAGVPTEIQQIAEGANLPARAVEILVAGLLEDALLHSVDREGAAAYVPSRPAETINTAELLKTGQRLVGMALADESAAAQWLGRFREAQLQVNVHTTLAKL